MSRNITTPYIWNTDAKERVKWNNNNNNKWMRSVIDFNWNSFIILNEMVRRTCGIIITVLYKNESYNKFISNRGIPHP